MKMSKPILIVTERFSSAVPPDREFIQATVTLWLTGAIQAPRCPDREV